MLALTISSLFGLTALASVAVLADSYLRGWNRFRALRSGGGSLATNGGDFRITRIGAATSPAFPGLRPAGSRRLTTARTGVSQSRPLRAAA